MLRTAEKNEKKRPSTRPADKPGKGNLCRKRGLTPQNRSMRAVFCLTNFRASFLSFLAPPREAQRSPKKGEKNGDDEAPKLRRTPL